MSDRAEDLLRAIFGNDHEPKGTPHTCTTITPGCFRCELNRDEIGYEGDGE